MCHSVLAQFLFPWQKTSLRMIRGALGGNRCFGFGGGSLGAPKEWVGGGDLIDGIAVIQRGNAETEAGKANGVGFHSEAPDDFSRCCAW